MQSAYQIIQSYDDGYYTYCEGDGREEKERLSISRRYIYVDVDGNLFDVASPPTINEARYLGCNHHVAASFNISSLTVGQ